MSGERFTTSNGDLQLHPTWMRLAPGKDEEHKEDKQQYINRIRLEFPNIPEDILEQWIYPYHFNDEIRFLYGWMNYEQVCFSLATWTNVQIESVKMYSGFSRYVENTTRKVLMALPNKLPAIELREEVIRSWTEYGTWRTPIIVLASKEIMGVPEGVELRRPFQLVEGHTRLGWFNAFRACKVRGSPYPLAESHKLWLMNAGW